MLSALAVAAVLFCQAERAAEGIEKPVALGFFVVGPVFFGRRNGEAKQVRNTGKHAAAHADTEPSAFEDPRRSGACGRQPADDLFR